MRSVRFLKAIFLTSTAVLFFAACESAPNTSESNAAFNLARATASEGVGCGSRDLCLGLKVVSYSEAGVPVVDAATVRELVASVNQVWSQCGIGFQLEDYTVVEPKDLGLSNMTEYMSELPRIRSTFQSDNQLLVVLTEKWGAKGDINDSGADAWTTLPGNPPYGAVIDQPVSRNSIIIAHEI